MRCLDVLLLETVNAYQLICRWAVPTARAASVNCFGVNDTHVMNNSSIRYDNPVFPT